MVNRPRGVETRSDETRSDQRGFRSFILYRDLMAQEHSLFEIVQSRYRIIEAKNRKTKAKLKFERKFSYT